MMSGTLIQNGIGARDASTSIYVAPSLAAARDALSDYEIGRASCRERV